MKKDILKLGMKIVKNTAIKLAERDANTTCPYYGYQAELPWAVKKLKIRFFISFLHQSDWCIHRMHQGDIPLPKFTVPSGPQSPFPPVGRSFG